MSKAIQYPAYLVDDENLPTDMLDLRPSWRAQGRRIADQLASQHVTLEALGSIRCAHADADRWMGVQHAIPSDLDCECKYAGSEEAIRQPVFDVYGADIGALGRLRWLLEQGHFVDETMPTEDMPPGAVRNAIFLKRQILADLNAYHLRADAGRGHAQSRANQERAKGERGKLPDGRRLNDVIEAAAKRYGRAKEAWPVFVGLMAGGDVDGREITQEDQLALEYWSSTGTKRTLTFRTFENRLGKVRAKKSA